MRVLVLAMSYKHAQTHLKLIGAALAAHHMTTGAERGVDLLLAAQHAQQRLPQLPQPLLQRPALLAAAAVRPLVLLLVPARRAWRGGALAAPGHQVGDAGVVEGAPGVIVHLLGRAADVENILLAQVDVFVEEERGQVALEVPAVLHHYSVGHRVTPVEITQEVVIRKYLLDKHKAVTHNSDSLTSRNQIPRNIVQQA